MIVCNELIYFNIPVNVGIFDTGATTSLITEEAYDRIKNICPPLTSPSPIVQGVSGTKILIFRNPTRHSKGR